MSGQTAGKQVIEVSIGFAADSSGHGVAFAAEGAEAAERVQRVRFRVRGGTAGDPRAAGYAAVTAVARAFRAHYDGGVRFLTADATLVADLEDRRPVPGALTIPYVSLRCALNRFSEAEVSASHAAEVADLTARAVAEVSLRVAA
jgi:hypothetical protein